MDTGHFTYACYGGMWPGRLTLFTHTCFNRRWLGRFARYPVGADDAGGASALAASGQLSPLQKGVMSAVAALAPLPAPEACWPEAISMMCETLRPFRLMQYRCGWV